MDDDEPDSGSGSGSGSDSERSSSEDDDSGRDKSVSRADPQPPAADIDADVLPVAVETEERLPEETRDYNASAVKPSSSSNLKRRLSMQSSSSKRVTAQPQLEAAGRTDASTAQHAANKNPVEMLERLDLDILEQVKQRLLVELHKVDPGVSPGAPPPSTTTANASLTAQQQPHAAATDQQTEQETCAQATAVEAVQARISSEPLVANPLERSPAECARTVVASRKLDGVEVQPPEQRACGQTIEPADHLANESSLFIAPATHVELEQTISSDSELMQIIGALWILDLGRHLLHFLVNYKIS